MKIKNVFSLKTLAVIMVAGIGMLASCSKSNSDSPLGGTDSQNVNSESVAASSTDESADMSSSVVGGVSDTKLSEGSRVSGHIEGGLFDARLAGATITITPNADSVKAGKVYGTITIDFGTGITVNGVTRKGVINIVYWGHRWAAGSYRTLTYSNYYRNDIKVDGTFKITNVSSDSTTQFTFHHQLTGGLLTFPDATGTTVQRNSDYLVVWDFSAKTISIENSGATSATGVTRKGLDYSMNIISALVYKASCRTSGVFIPVSGEKTITTDSKTYDINYGDGTCDNSIIVTIGNKSVTITADSNGN
ncbi:MAG: hypothetical protein QM734_10590 [Cyclobacteriaceae bacterium]